MRYINNYIKGLLGVSLLAVILYSCTKFEDYTSKEPVLGAPTVDLAVATIKDYSVVVSATSSLDGFMAVAVFVGSDTTEYNKIDLLSGNVAAIAYKYERVIGGDDLFVGFEALEHNTVYRVLAVASNREGNTGNVAELIITTDDTVDPTLDEASVDPGVATDAIQAVDFAVTLPFDEPVVVVDASKIMFGYMSLADYSITWVPVTDAEITEGGSTVTVAQPEPTENRQYVFLTVEAGAITDIVGNEFAGIESGIDLDAMELYGLFWRTEARELQIESISPEPGIAQTDPTFAIEITFDIAVRFGANFSSDILDESIVTLTYLAPDNTLNEVMTVPRDSISIAGSVVTIHQPYVAGPGEQIYLSIGPGAFRDANSNLNAAYVDPVGGDGGWLISKGYTVDLVYGDYLATCTSYFPPNNEYVFSVRIEEDTEVEDGVIITGLEGSEEPIHGVFDGVWGQITIASEESLGDLIGDGSEVLTIGYDFDAGDVIPIIAEVDADGNIVCSWGSYISGGDYDGYFWDYYENSTWEKQAGKTVTTPSGSMRSMNFTHRIKK
jgi:hypothetical protein